MRAQGQGARANSVGGKLIPAGDPCCCGDEPPPPPDQFGYMDWKDCRTGLMERRGAGGGTLGDCNPPGTGESYPERLLKGVYWDLNNGRCVEFMGGGYLPARPALPTIAFNFVGCEACDDCKCTGDCDVPPIWPPDPPPIVCGCGTFVDGVNCKCIPATVRCTISGTTNCVCLGPCGDYSVSYAVLDTGQTINGTFDLVWDGGTAPPGWTLTVTRNVLIGTIADGGCVTFNNSSFDIVLRKMSATWWAFAVANSVSINDPRELIDGIEQIFLFSGSAQGGTASCLLIPVIANAGPCGCHTTPYGTQTQSHFFLTTLGTAAFEACPA